MNEFEDDQRLALFDRLMSLLERLAALRGQELITDEEFQRLKARLLGPE